MNKTLRLRQKLSSFFIIPILFFGFLNSNTNAISSTELSAQVKALQAQINDGNAKAKELSAQADNLKKAVAGLDIQISQANIQIEQTTLKIAELQANLDATQAELDKQKDLLKDSMVALYKKGGASSVELLIGSDSFSQFIDSQEYLTRLKSAIQKSTEKVILLKQQIQSQQDEQEELLKIQQAQKDTVAATRSERQSLLDQTQGDEARYRAVVVNLREQQIEANKRLFAQVRLEQGDGSSGGYQYNSYAFSMTFGSCGPGEGPDRWGYCTRQCVSYAAWAVERSGRQAPMYYGDAKDWATIGGRWRVPNPRAGDVGVGVGGTWGHVAYVEEVYGNGTMRISQYNAELTGRYSEATVSVNHFNTYLRFP